MRSALPFVWAFALTADCSESPGGRNEQVVETGRASEATAPETIASKGGSTFTVVRTARDRPSTLPSNADLKMSDGDLAKYGMSLCDENLSDAGKLTRCDVYVQPDRSGTLVGYAVVGQGDKGTSFHTVADLRAAGHGARCSFGGRIDLEGAIDASGALEGRNAYSAWEKEPGNWLISPEAATDDENFASGVWYLKRSGDKLRITQERWNPCYPGGTDVYIDEVFYRAVTLTKAAPSR